MEKPYILHLENNRFFIEQVRWVMDDKPVSYDWAYDETQVKEKMKKQKPDLLVVDLMLDNDFDSTKGVDFLKRLNMDESYLKVKVMVLSARGDLRDKLEGMVDYYQTKDDIEEACNKMMELIG